MELSLSLGDTPPKKHFSQPTKIIGKKELGFCMAVTGNVCANAENLYGIETVRPPVQLDLLPFSPVHRTQQPPPFPSLTNNLVSEPGSNRRVDDNEEGAAAISSPTSTASSFQNGLSVFRRAIKGKTYFEGLIIADHNVNEAAEADRSRALSKGISDEEFENGNNIISRKKLRLTREQSAFLEQSFKEHSTLNPKQKKDLAKQLNLRTRQVEVWFQNRRARTKLKKTEVDCEHLKRCCETLTQENRKLQKEIEELRALNKPSYMQRPPTTLTMCPSCQRVVTTTANEPARLLSLSS